MTTTPRTVALEVACLLAIAAAAIAVLAERQSLRALASAHAAAAPAMDLRVAQERVDRLESQLGDKPQRPPAAPAALEPIKKLQLRVEAARSRDSVRSAYGPLLKALGLDPAAQAHFEDLIAQERLAARDAVVAARAEGLASYQAYKTAVEEAVGPYDDQLSAVLSPNGFAQFDGYRQSLPEQETVADLAARLAGSATPLSESQQAQLVQLIDEMEPPVYHQNQSFLSLIGMDEAPLTTAMVTAAPSILSPPQAAALQTIQSAGAARSQLQQALRQHSP